MLKIALTAAALLVGMNTAFALSQFDPRDRNHDGKVTLSEINDFYGYYGDRDNQTQF